MGGPRVVDSPLRGKDFWSHSKTCHDQLAMDKVVWLWRHFDSTAVSLLTQVSDASDCDVFWDHFQPLQTDEVGEMLADLCSTMSNLDPCPSCFNKSSRGGLNGWVWSLANASLHKWVVSMPFQGMRW